MAAPLDPELSSLPGARAVWMPDTVFGGGVYVVIVDPPGGDPPGGVRAPTLVLVHGLGTVGIKDFFPVLPALARGRRVVTFDLPGFGLSGRANERYTPARYAAVLSQVIDRYAGGQADVLGHSMGGAISLMHAGVYPVQVRRLVLVDAAGILHREAWFGHHLRRVTDPASLVFPAAVDDLNWLIAKMFSTARILDVLPDVVMLTPGLRKKVLDGVPGRIAALGLILADFSAPIANVKAPTLVVWGSKDTVAPVRTGDLLADRLSATYRVLEGVGHNVMAEAPDALVDAVEAFLSSPTAPSPPPVVPGTVSRGDTVCSGRNDVHFTGRYDDIVLDKCERVSLDGVSAHRLVVRNSTVRVVRSTITSGIMLANSDLVMTGGYVGGDVPVEVVDGEADLAGTTLEARPYVYRLGGTSRAIFSVCPVGAGAGHLHGVIDANGEVMKGGVP